MTTKRRTKSILILLAVFLISIVCAIGAFCLSAKQSKVRALDYTVLSIEEAVDTFDIEIEDGALIPRETEYTIAWSVNAYVQEFVTFNVAAQNWAKEIAASVDKYKYGNLMYDVSFMLFEETALPPLDGATIEYKSWAKKSEDGGWDPFAGLYINDQLYNPAYEKIIDGPSDVDVLNQKVSFYVGRENIHKNYVPVIVIRAGMYVRGKGLIMHLFRDVNEKYARVIINREAIRSVNYVAGRAYEVGDYENEAERNFLLKNMSQDDVVDQELASNSIIEGLEKNFPLSFSMVPGAEFANGRITWKCKMESSSFDEWKKICNKISFNWLVLKFKNFNDTDNCYEDFMANFQNAEGVFPDCELKIEEGKYVSNISWEPEDEKTYYIALPYIKVVGIKAQVLNKNTIPFNGVQSGTYITCEQNDNARSKASFLGNEDGEFIYNFHYLQPYSDKPFAKAVVKTLSRTERIDFNNVGMADFAEICGLELNKEGNVECLLSIINYWLIEQSSTHTYNIRASYSVLPLTLQDDKGTYEIKYVGLTPFSSLTHVGLEEGSPVTMIRNAEGEPYFNTLWEVESHELYGYFYTYSYATNQTDPNWKVNPDMYDGAMVYFTRKLAQTYQIGYGELLLSGALSGAFGLGKKISTVANANVEALEHLLIVTDRDVCGQWAEDGAFSLFSQEWNSTTTTFNIEYGFLDGTSLTPGIFYKTEAEGEISQFEQILLIVIIAAEVIALCWFLSKIKKLHPVFVVLAMLAFVGLFIWLDVLVWNFFLVG